MAEIIEGEVVSEGQVPAAPEAVGGDGVTKGLKKPIVQPTANDNRIKLYNEILNLKEQGFSDVYKKIGYKKFDSLLQNDSEFQSALLTDLNERGFDISPEDFAFAYTKQKPAMVADFDEVPVSKEEPLPQKDEDGLLSQVKGMFKSVYNATKEPLEDLYKFAKRGFYTGLGGRGAQAENFATGTVDTKNLAQYLKKANDVGATRIEAEFAKDDGLLKDTDDLLAILIPSVVESFANMAGAGYKKLLGITAAGAGAGAMVGGLPGAAVGGSRALQGAMLQQGYNLEFVGTVIDELATKKAINLDADENTLEKQLNAAFANKELMGPIFQKANTRAAAITATDFVLSGMGATVARNLAKSKAAGRVMNTKVGQMFSDLAEKTVANPIYRKAARLTNRVAEIDKKIAGSKLGKAGATVGIQDMFGGAAGETLAQALTQEELDWKSIAVEAGAEGKFINTLRALGKIGEKKIAQKAISQFATEKNLPPNQKPPAPEDEFVAVTEEELSNYKKGNVSPERAAGVADDVDIAFKDPTHIEKVKAADKLYGEMLQDAFNKHMAALENQKLRDVALTSTGETYGKTAEEIAAIIDPNNPAYNEKIANEFKNAYEVLKQQYKEQTGDDSEDTTGVSGEVGKGKKSQQAESEQGASEEETGNGGVVQAAADEVRLSDIDEMLADDDNFFKDTGDRLLSPEERQDLEQERARLTGGAATPSTGASTAATPAAAPAAVVTQPPTTTVTAPAITETTPVVEDVEAVPVEEETVTGGTATTTTTTPTTKRGKKAAATTTTVAETKTEEKPTVKQIKASDVEIRKGKTHATDGVYEAVYNKKVIGKISFDKKEKMWVDASGDKFAQKKDAVAKMVLQYNMKAEAAAETTTAKGEGKGKVAPTGKAEPAPTTETKGETKPTGKAETTTIANTETKPTGAAMPSSIQEAYSRRATLRMTADNLQKQMGGKKLSPKAQKELDTVNAEIAKLDNLLNTFEKEREKQRAAKAKAEQTSEKKETKTEEKPTTLVGGTVKGMAYGNYLINQLVLKDPKGEESRQGYIDAWNAINKAQENAVKANSFLEEILVGMMPADKKPTAYADIREGFKQQQAGETTTETKGETKPTETTETKTENDKNIDFVFESHPQLSEIGTKQQYAEYLKTIFPKSKVKDIVYHGTDHKQSFNNILKNGFETSKNFGNKYWLTPINHKITGDTSLYSTADYGDNIISALINVNKYETVRKNDFTGSESENPALTGVRKDESNDTMIVRQGSSALFDKNRKDYDAEWAKKADKVGFYIVFDPKQIHVLGGEKDVQGFKNFVANAKPTEKTETKPTTSAAPSKAPSFSEFDAISADRSKMKEAKAEFIAKHGQLAYDAMKEISANFTKITKALQEKEILTKKC